MENLDDIFDGGDLGLGEEVVDNVVLENEMSGDMGIFEEDNTNDTTNSILDEFLKLKGIENNKVTILEEDNTEKEVNFYELSKEEQLDLLNLSENDPNIDLDDAEIELLNSIRSKNLSVSDFLESYKNEILQSAAEGNQPDTESYEIDSYDDQELYLLDLKNKYDLTDEELIKELEKELQDEDLFKKKTDVLRSEYKTLEDNYKETQLQEANKEKEANYNQFVDQMVDIAIKTPDFYGIDLDDDEKNEVLTSILELDENGASAFYKSISNPKELYRVAWFQRYGEEAFNVLKAAYEEEINNLKKDNSKSKPVVIKPGKEVNTIYDLNF